MNEAVKQFVSPQQNGFVPGGFIAENTMLLKLIQAYVEDENEEAFFIFLDMEKAFDRCSWDYLRKALTALGFNQNFINYINLFYSHENPPTRRININGRLGESFPLASGVAQGCPLSPLLFLVVTEALTRAVTRDDSIEGVRINGTAHKISQYADDSILIARVHDWVRMKFHLDRWCAATAMRENATKREGLLLGKLNRNRRLAPRGIMPSDAWQPNGKPIKSLGVPFGNGIDGEILDAWWQTKMNQVKDRISAWKTLSPVSLDGRSLLVQAVLYGSVRYWFFSLPTPDWVIEELSKAAYHILWASDPLVSPEDETASTATRARAHIVKPASYLPRKSGGGSVLHLESHVRAFQAQWIRRYLEPGEPPWKSVVDHWIASHNVSPIGRGLILGHIQDPDFAEQIPLTAPYLRRCFHAFAAIRFKQDTSYLNDAALAEPLFFNWRFEADASNEDAQAWSKYIGLKRLLNLFDADTGDLFTDEEMREYTFTHAPSDIQNTPRAHEFSDNLMQSWPALRDSIPRNLVRMAQQQSQAEGIVYVEPEEETNRAPFYARLVTTPGGQRLRKIFLDVRNTPYDTDELVPQWLAIRSAQIKVIWWKKILTEDDPDRDRRLGACSERNSGSARKSSSSRASSGRTR